MLMTSRFAATRSRARRSLVAGALLALLAALLAPMLVPVDTTARTSPEQQLADKHVPVLMVREQSAPCDKSGEGYFPVPVDFLFDNPDILLRASADGNAVLSTGITPQLLAEAPAASYLDFPGDPRQPGCGYEQYFRDQVAKHTLTPTTYVHIFVDEAARKVYLEYWFYYYFNDWNDTHESDWEMLMLVFDATSVEEALTRTPVLAGFAQHGGGEIARWDDPKLQREGDRPVAFASAGSHATYFTAETYIGWGENGSAFGCDKTITPSTRLDLTAIVVPETPDPEGEFAWALYQGRWGEKQASIFNGPKGPNLGKKWTDPAAAIENWRDSSLTVPGSDAATLGPSSTAFFCSFSARISKVGIYLGSHPVATLALVLAAVLIIVRAFAMVWSQILEAIDIYGIELRAFLGIGILAVPIGLVFHALTIAAQSTGPAHWIAGWAGDTTGSRLATTATLGGAQQLLMIIVITPAVVRALRDLRRGVKPTALRSIVGGVRDVPTLLLATLAVGAIIAAGTLTLVLLPVAIYFAVRLQYVAQPVILDQAGSARAALAASWRITRGGWWRAFVWSFAFNLLGLLPGPLVGAFVLIAGGARVDFANFVSSFVYAVFIPISVIGLTMSYHRLAGHPIVEPAMRTARPVDAPATAAGD
jgi:hypothetical protein